MTEVLIQKLKYIPHSTQLASLQSDISIEIKQTEQSTLPQKFDNTMPTMWHIPYPPESDLFLKVLEITHDNTCY